jgi:hypothetical protein
LDILERYISAIKIKTNKIKTNEISNLNFKKIKKNDKKPIQTNLNNFILHNVVKNLNNYNSFKKFELSEENIHNILSLDFENFYNKINLKKSLKNSRILKKIKINENGPVESS